MNHRFAFVAAAAAAAAAAGMWIGSAAAAPRAVGVLTVATECPAYQAVSSGANPGQIRLEVGKTYAVIGRNRSEDASHYRVIVEGASPAERWVGVDCGFYTQSAPRPVARAEFSKASRSSGDFILALSWWPAICENKDNNKPECRNLTDKSYVADHFALRGLWPLGDRPGGSACKGAPTKVKACNCPTAEHSFNLPPALQDELLKIMPDVHPGMGLYRWMYHGACASNSQKDYYSLSIQLVAQLNGASPQKLFADNLGKAVTAEQIRAAFDDAFGPGAGQRVAIGCYNDKNSHRRMISDIYINLRGPIAADAKLADLIKAAPPARDNCARGVVDRVGLQ